MPGWLATLAAATSAVSFLWLASLQGVAGASWIAIPIDWFRFSSGPASLQASLGLQADSLGLAMALLVSIAGTLIALYSVQYMEHDNDRSRYFAGFSLFLSAMLILTLADNIFLTFVGWEGVGLASYLLIGHYWKESYAPPAAWKAFFTNRVGDVLFLLGAFILFRELGAADYASMRANFLALEATEALNFDALTLAAILLLGGVAGKSAQIPLHVWLPDAMAGPTPVSALIHAATMVTAGVYLVARMHWFFAAIPLAMIVLLVAALATLLLGSILAAYQADIKRALAYSTLANLGLMFLAHAAAAPRAAMEHLFAHALFKALLFLAAGSVIHFAHHEQNLHRLKGALRRLPVTRAAFWIGAFGSIGALPWITSSYYSKELILNSLAQAQFHAAGVHIAAAAVYWIAFVAELLAVLYTFRILGYLESPADDERSQKWSEEGIWIRLTLALIALATLGFGVVRGAGWLETTFFAGFGALPESHSSIWHSLVFVALAAAVFANFVSPSVRSRWQRYVRLVAHPAGPFERRFYLDDLVEGAVARPTLRAAEQSNELMEPEPGGGLLGLFGDLLLRTGQGLRKVVSGLINEYAALLVAATAAALLVAILMMRGAW